MDEKTTKEKVPLVDWAKVVNGALQIFVATLMISAAAIVWQKAMSIDDKVRTTKEEMQNVIDVMADELSKERSEHIALKNEVATLGLTLSNKIDQIGLFGPPMPLETPEEFVNSPDAMMIQQKALKSDIKERLQKK